MSRRTLICAPAGAEDPRMRRWLTLILTTVVATAVVAAAAVGVDVLWQWAPGSTPVAAVVGDPRIELDAELPASPDRVAVFEVTGPVTKAQLREILPGRIEQEDGWLTWWGHCDVPVREILRQLQPQVQWRVQRGDFLPTSKSGVFGPVGPGQPDITSGGLSPAFTGTDAVTNSFGRYLKDDDGRLHYMSLPAVRIAQAGTQPVITAEEALRRLRHHDESARVLSPDLTLLTSRLAGQAAYPMPAITDVRLLQAQDPDNVSMSRPVWVFEPVGEVDALR